MAGHKSRIRPLDDGSRGIGVVLFMLEEDTGDEITAYLAPDNPTEPARLRVVSGDSVLWEGEANESRPAIVAAGRHRTGACGFRIGPALAPGLAEHEDLALVEAVSDLTIYRRAGSSRRIPRKLLRLETSLEPMTVFDLAAERLFQAWYPNIDRLGQETTTQTFLHPRLDSIYLSGRLLMPNHSYYHDLGFSAVVMLRDPYLELADRLAILSGARGPLGLHLSERDRMVFGNAIEALVDLDTTDPDAVRRRMRRLERRVAAELSNPLGRQLTTTRPDDLCRADSVSSALRALANFDVVGIEDDGAWFARAVADLVGVEHLPSQPRRQAEAALEIAAALVDVPSVEALIDIDLEIYDTVGGLFDGDA